MNLDELISKYLDGELTESEDKLFRKVLAEDDIAREKFDSAMNLHLSFKEDAESVHPPKKLIEQTEDLIMMKIFANAPENKRRKPVFWFNPQMIAAAIVILLFLFVFRLNENINTNNYSDFNEQQSSLIDENKTSLKNDLATAQIFDDVRQDSKEEINIVKTKVNQKQSKNFDSAIHTSKINEPINQEVSNQSFAAEIQNDITNQNANIKDNFNSEELNDKINFKDNSKKEIIAFYQNQNINEIQELNLNNFKQINITGEKQIISQNDEQKITLSSFFGTDVARGGMTSDKSLVSHFSQAVAYEINDDENFGFEVGFSQYAYNEEAEITVEKSLGELSGSSAVESNEGGIDFSIAYPQVINVQSNTQILWASAFYERSLYRFNGLNLVTRVGAGFSNDGVLGYSKFIVQYRVFKSVDIVIGAEGRLFQVEVNKYLGDKSNFKSSASLIYGVQFTF